MLAAILADPRAAANHVDQALLALNPNQAN
jgi:hypothetical protein